MRSVSTKVTGNTYTANEFNELPSQELQNAVLTSGQSLSAGDLNQLGKAMAVYGSAGDFYTDGGTANSYVLTPIGVPARQSPPAYVDGVRVRFVAGNTNTGASTINLNGLGVKSLKENGGDVAATRIKAGSIIEATYLSSPDEFELVGVSAADFLPVANIVDLKAVNADNLINNQRAFVAGYFSVGGLGGGPFFWDSSSTDTDNGGTVIIPTFAGFSGTGRWKRDVGNIITVEMFGAKGDNIADDFLAIQAALNDKKFVMLSEDQTYKTSGDLTYAFIGQVLSGVGDSSVINYTGAGTAIDFNNRFYATASNFKLTSTTALIGIDVGDPGHNFSISRVHIDGALTGVPTGFTTAGIQVERSFYGKIEHCDIEFCKGSGIFGFREFNGNFIVSNSIRQNGIGIKITADVSNSEGNSIIGNEIESANTNTTHGIQILGADSNMIIGNRLEINVVGATQIEINSGGVGDNVAQFNQIIGNALEGSSTNAIVLGDGVGVNKVLSTYITGGRSGTAIVINSDCLNTTIMAPPGAHGGAFTDNGASSIVMIDPANSKWYIKNAANKGFDLLVGGVATRLNVASSHTFEIQANAVTEVEVSTSGLRFPNLPTSVPASGFVWNNAGVVNIA